MESARAYQKTLSYYHRDLIKLTQSRTLHEHYRHTERLQKFTHMEEEVSHKAVQADLELQKAQARLNEVEQSKAILEQEKAVLISSGVLTETGGEMVSAVDLPDPSPASQPQLLTSAWPPVQPMTAPFLRPGSSPFGPSLNPNPSVFVPPPTLPGAGPLTMPPTSPPMMPMSGNFG